MQLSSYDHLTPENIIFKEAKEFSFGVNEKKKPRNRKVSWLLFASMSLEQRLISKRKRKSIFGCYKLCYGNM